MLIKPTPAWTFIKGGETLKFKPNFKIGDWSTWYETTINSAQSIGLTADYRLSRSAYENYVNL